MSAMFPGKAFLLSNFTPGSRIWASLGGQERMIRCGCLNSLHVFVFLFSYTYVNIILCYLFNLLADTYT